MSLDEQWMQHLQATQGDASAQAAVMAELLLLAQSKAERESKLDALDAAAVLRWFDAELLRFQLQARANEGTNTGT